MLLKNTSGKPFKVHSGFYVEADEEIDPKKLSVIKPRNLQKLVDAGVFTQVEKKKPVAKKPRRRRTTKKPDSE